LIKLGLWVLFFYTIIGYIYNLKNTNKRGAEAVPMIDVWRGLGSSLESAGRTIKSKMSGINRPSLPSLPSKDQVMGTFGGPVKYEVI